MPPDDDVLDEPTGLVKDESPEATAGAEFCDEAVETDTSGEVELEEDEDDV